MRPQTLANIRTFETSHFRVTVDALEDYDVDLSWDDTGEVREKLETGEFVAFCARARVEHKETGAVLAEDYLGGCIYKSPEEFMDHRGIREAARKVSARKGREITIGGYFADMVHSVCQEARKQHAELCAVRLRG